MAMSNAKLGLRSVVSSAATAQRRFGRQRASSLSTIPPNESSEDYIPELAAHAASILYLSPLPSQEGRPVYILNAAAFPDAFEVDYDSLLSYVLDRLPKEDELLSGSEYEIVFFAGGQPEGATTEKKNGPGVGWYIQAYQVLSRALRKKLQRLYIVHPRTWVRALLGAFGTIVSPKFRRKLIHVNTLSALALHIPVENLLIPPSVYLQDRKVSSDIYVPYATGRRAFGAHHQLPRSLTTGQTRLPRVLRETTAFLLSGENINTEGLFRIPPNAVLSGVLKEAYDRGQRWIIWKERSTTLVERGADPQLIREIKLEDAYTVHQAAALIKLWYRELLIPIIPESAYAGLREKYGSPNSVVTAEDLVDLILPQSQTSPLSLNDRDVLTRHLLPLLSEVVAHEPANKMNAENLAICFAMCLVGSANEMADAQISPIVRKILMAAISMWPELREGMGISRDEFWEELKPPADSRDYEDPFDEPRPSRSQRLSEDDALEGQEGHRIVLEDVETGVVAGPAPRLPSRPSSTSPANNSPSDATTEMRQPPAIPRRKPAPHHVEQPPPRYSQMFDDNGGSIVGDSPASYTPANGFGPPRSSGWSLDEDMKKGFPPSEYPAPTDPHPALGIPKRKAVSSEYKPATPPNETSGEPVASTSQQQQSIATMAADMGLGRIMAAPPNLQITSPDVVASPETNSATSSEPAARAETNFRKPSWPASARPQPGPKPNLPPRISASTVPIINQPIPSPNLDGAVPPAPPNVPRVRAPSPGLLKRMGSMDTASMLQSAGPSSTYPPASLRASGSSSTTGFGSAASGDKREGRLTEPRKLNLKKASVEDLRRLYEERNSVAESLAQADAKRRASSSGTL